MHRSNKTRLLHFAVAFVGAGVLASFANAAPGDIYNLGTLGSGHTSSAGQAINASEQVAGYSTTASNVSRAFRYSGTPGAGGAMADLGTLGGNSSYSEGINDAGQVAGTSTTPITPGGTTTSHAFRYTGTPGSGGAMADLGTLGGASSNSYGRAINNVGQVAGNSWIGVSTTSHAFRYTGTPGSGGAMVDLGTLGGTDSYAYAINDAGQVAGWSWTTGNTAFHAFRYSGTPGSGGAMADLGTLGGNTSEGHDINDAGQVAGYSQLTGSAARHAFRYTGTPGSGGAMVDLGTLGGAESYAFGINDAGFVVGHAQRSAGAGGGFAATLWQVDAANTAVDLDAWLDANNPTLGAFWTLGGSPADINNNGLISGTGTYNDGPGGLTDGTRAYILDASSLVPEPSGLALIAIGGLALLRRRQRRQQLGSQCQQRGSQC